ncbi:MAG: site-specific DNA-methyltransferase [Candidatus Poribacteria bacterium]|nr:site-specific DNA-methyltransferase [Candidatus Poribacteria bacterium]
MFTKEDDWVLDPFAGSGTTCQVAQKLLRNSAGIEISPEYYQLAQENIKQKPHLENQFQTQFSSTQSTPR